LRVARVPINVIGHHVRSAYDPACARAVTGHGERNPRADLIDGLSPRSSPATHRTMNAVAVGLAADKTYVDDINNRY